MNILHIVSSIDLSSGGPSKSVSDLALNQAIMGYDVTIFTNASKNAYLKVSPISNLNLHFVNGGSFKKALKTILIIKKYDIIHGHGIWQMPIHHMAQLAMEFGIPYIISPRGMLEPWALNSGKWKKKLALWLYQSKDLKRAKCIHATAEMEAKSLGNLGFKNPIAVIPNGIDMAEFSFTVKTERKGMRTLLFLSRIHPKKGIEFLIEAWQMLDKSIRRGWQIEIVGNGHIAYIELLQKLIHEKGFSSEILIIGPLFGEAKLDAYKRANIFVLPTYSENFGVVIAEALACGVPVITTKGAPWEELNAFNAGWWIDIGAKPLAETLRKAFQLKEMDLQIMGANGRNLVEEKYSIQSVASSTLELYRWILGTGIKPKFVYI